MPFITQGKTNLRYILIVIILAAIVGGGILGYLYLYPIERSPTPPEVSPVDETADWKTYRNEEYGYEIKYPNEWSKTDCNDNSMCLVSRDYISFDPSFVAYPTQGILFTIGVFDKPAGSSSEYKCSSKSTTCKDILIDGTPAAQTINYNRRTLPAPEKTTITEMVTNFYKDDYLYNTVSVYPQKCWFEEGDEGIYYLTCVKEEEIPVTINQILATFKFLE